MIGVVVGSYGLPSCVALNVAAILHSNPAPVHILVHDDCTPPDRDPTGFFQKQHAEFELYRTSQTLGHVAGDISCFVAGLRWACSHQFEYLVKLSQRYIMYQPDWLANATRQARAEDAVTMAQQAYHGGKRPWGRQGIRTECVFMRVKEWANEGIYKFIEDARVTPEMTMRIVAESHVHPGKLITRWRMVSPDKAAKREGVLWHDVNTEREYEALAEKLGVELQGYTNAAWKLLMGHGYKLG